jgi:hypothetical protein
VLKRDRVATPSADAVSADVEAFEGASDVLDRLTRGVHAERGDRSIESRLRRGRGALERFLPARERDGRGFEFDEEKRPKEIGLEGREP